MILAGGSHGAADFAQIRRSLEERIGAAVETVDPTQAVSLTDRIAASPTFVDSLAPLVGLLLRDRGVAA